MKRIFDVVMAVILILFFLPLLLLLALLVFMFIGKPVIFKQGRIGLNEKKFQIFKFRSMNNKTAANGELLPDHERLTQFGRFLRSTSLDELPELINVVRGEMSLVGPRPLLEEYLHLYSETQRKRHSVRPGITGLAQISGRNSLSWEEKFELDLCYIDNQSILSDLNILLKTFLKVLGRSDVNQGAELTAEKFKG